MFLKGKIKERRTILDALNVFEGRYLLKMSRLKAISRKFMLLRGGGLKNLSGVFTGEGMPIFKKFGCFENYKFWRF